MFRLFLAFGKAIDFYAQIIARFLPKDLAVGHVEQILISYFITTESPEMNDEKSFSFESIANSRLKTHLGISSRVTLAGTSLSSGTQ